MLWRSFTISNQKSTSHKIGSQLREFPCRIPTFPFTSTNSPAHGPREVDVERAQTARAELEGSGSPARRGRGMCFFSCSKHGSIDLHSHYLPPIINFFSLSRPGRPRFFTRSWQWVPEFFDKLYIHDLAD